MKHLNQVIYTSLFIAGMTPLQGKAGNNNCSNNNNNAPMRPNVVLIVADDLGYGDLSCYGAHRVQTPNVDRLAQGGIRFTNMHATASTSTPSRYSLLTGHYAWRRPDTRVAAGNAQMIIRPEQYTMADMFNNAGYATAAIGKWHLGIGNKTGEQDWNAPIPCGLQDIGFDYHYIMAATGDRVPCVFIEDGFIADYDADAPIEVSYQKNFDGEPTGRENPELLYNLHPSPDHGHENSIVNGISRIGYMKGGGKALWKDENIADSITSHAVDFIHRNSDNPFFLYLCTNDIHVPRLPHERFRGATEMGHRGDAIVQFDWTVGEVVKTIEELGLTDNTLIILTSDNGPVVDDGYADRAVELLGDHKPSGDLRGGKYSSFEAGTRVPMIVSWPQSVDAGKDSHALMSQVDMFASLAEMLHATLPTGACPDSRRHLPALLGKDEKGAEFVVQQNLWDNLSVRTADWKYIPPCSGESFMPLTSIETGNDPQEQLYNLHTPGESTNLAAQHPDIVAKLKAILHTVKSNGQ